MRRSLLLLVPLLAAGCARSVTFVSVPPGARVLLDGEELGRTPLVAEVSTSTWWGAARRVRVELPGYRTVEGPLDWAYDPRHWLLGAGVILPITQIAHLHPRAHRQPLARYTVVLDEVLDPADTTPVRRILRGSDDVAAGAP